MVFMILLVVFSMFVIMVFLWFEILWKFLVRCWRIGVGFLVNLRV